mmetsp:Transcript_41666/g.107876  ORF Transcript_41666/g.107876 Transcript_41666/m.107876 type:complete len:381 (+) Transcript_41666:223-1365(+)
MPVPKLPAVAGATKGSDAEEEASRADNRDAEAPGRQPERGDESGSDAASESSDLSEAESDEESVVQLKAEEVQFQGFPAPLDVQPAALLAHAANQIRVPKKTGLRAFRAFVGDGHPVARQVVEHAFWYLHCYFFFPGETRHHQKLLLDDMSSMNLKIFLMLPPNSRDFFTEYFPFIAASAVCRGFLVLFPGSNEHIKSEDFQNPAYVECRRLFTGVQSSPAVVRRLRNSLNLIEADPVAEEVRRKAMEPTFKEKTEQMIGRLDRVFNLTLVEPPPPKKHQKQHQRSDAFALPTDAEEETDSDLLMMPKLRTHPMEARSSRIRFEATGVSPLLSNIGYGKSGKKHIFIKQTQPPEKKQEDSVFKYRASAAKAKQEVSSMFY